MEPDSIAILQTAARGLVEAMKRKGYPAPDATFAVRSDGEPYVIVHTSKGGNFVCGYGDTIEDLVADALGKIEAQIKPAHDPRLAATLGIVEVEPGLWREAA